MDSDKYSRSVGLICPTCGSDQFEFEGGDETISFVKCVSCDREFPKDELIDENSEIISEHVNEIKDEINSLEELDFAWPGSMNAGARSGRETRKFCSHDR